MQLTQILNAISQGVMYPVIAILIILVAITAVMPVMTVVEFFTERRNFTVEVPVFVRQLEESDCQHLPGIIARAGLVRRQKLALMALFNARDLPEEARWNVAKRAVFETGRRYDRIASAAELIAKVAPMVGLMGTLIPLGPGIDALSSGDMATLASSLLIAFDTTVVGLISAALCLLIAKIRRRWNDDYANALEVMQSTLFDRIADLEEAGDLEYTPPVELVDDDDAAEEDAYEEVVAAGEGDAVGDAVAAAMKAAETAAAAAEAAAAAAQQAQQAAAAAAAAKEASHGQA